MESAHDRREIDFLFVVQFVSTRVPCDVDMSDDIDELIEAAHDITVHNLNMVDIEEHLYAIGSDRANNFGNEIDIIPLVAWMPFHRMGAISGIQVFEAEGHAKFFCERGEMFETENAVFDALSSRDFTARGILCIAPFVAGECDYVWESRVGGVSNRFFHAGEDLGVVRLIVESFDERCAGHSVGSEDTFQVVFLDGFPIFEGNDFHGIAAEFLGDFAEAVERPLVPAGLVAPSNDGLADIFFEV